MPLSICNQIFSYHCLEIKWIVSSHTITNHFSFTHTHKVCKMCIDIFKYPHILVKELLACFILWANSYQLTSADCNNAYLIKLLILSISLVKGISLSCSDCHFDKQLEVLFNLHNKLTNSYYNCYVLHHYHHHSHFPGKDSESYKSWLAHSPIAANL